MLLPWSIQQYLLFWKLVKLESGLFKPLRRAKDDLLYAHVQRKMLLLRNKRLEG